MRSRADVESLQLYGLGIPGVFDARLAGCAVQLGEAEDVRRRVGGTGDEGRYGGVEDVGGDGERRVGGG